MAKTLVTCPPIFQRFFDKNGEPLAGGLLYTYKSNTRIPVNTYKDSMGVALNTNPVVLNNEGYCSVFIENYTDGNEDNPTSLGYYFELYSSKGELIKTSDNIYALSGVDGKNTGIMYQGEKGDDGIQGNSIPGKDIVGPMGEPGSNGAVTKIFNVVGTKTFQTPNDIEVGSDLIITLIGGGGSCYLVKDMPFIDEAGTGTAGEMLTFKLSAVRGETLEITVGAGGTPSKDILGASGKSTIVKSDLYGTMTAKGGTPGKNTSLTEQDTIFERLGLYFNATTFEGLKPQLVPEPISGQSTKFGQGGNIKMNGSPDATGAGASGGSGLITIASTTNTLQCNQWGKGGDGRVEISYIVETKK